MRTALIAILCLFALGLDGLATPAPAQTSERASPQTTKARAATSARLSGRVRSNTPASIRAKTTHERLDRTGRTRAVSPDLRQRGSRLRPLVIERERTVVREVVVTQIPAETERETLKPATPVLAPVETTRARGLLPSPAPAAPGERLPEGTPFVTLDRRTYDLPALPPGRIYARVRGQIYVLDPDDRRIHARLDPATLR